jgi:hypothetical protein
MDQQLQDVVEAPDPAVSKKQMDIRGKINSLLRGVENIFKGGDGPAQNSQPHQGQVDESSDADAPAAVAENEVNLPTMQALLTLLGSMKSDEDIS